MIIPVEVQLMILGALMIFVYLIVRWRLNVEKKYQFEFIFMRPGVNYHEIMRGDELEFSHKYETKTYKITSERLYRVKPRFMKRIQFKLVGINQKFIVTFQNGKYEPLEPVKVKVSSRILGEVKDSRALFKALKNEFSIPMDLKRIVIIIGGIIIVALVYLVATGQMVIG